MDKNLLDKIKDGVSVQDVEDFARKYTTELFFVVAVLIGGISSMYDFFTGPYLTLFVAALGVMTGVFFPNPTENFLKKFYNFTFMQEKATQMIFGAVYIILGLFLPFVIFALVGILAGTSYHYYTRNAQIMSQNKPNKKKSQE
jgi:hypothetical protein